MLHAETHTQSCQSLTPRLTTHTQNSFTVLEQMVWFSNHKLKLLFQSDQAKCLCCLLHWAVWEHVSSCLYSKTINQTSFGLSRCVFINSLSKTWFPENLHLSCPSTWPELAQCFWLLCERRGKAQTHCNTEIQGDSELNYSRCQITTFLRLSTIYNLVSVPLSPLWPQNFPSIHSFIHSSFTVSACYCRGCGYYMP